MEKDYYDILGVPENASQEEIEDAFRYWRRITQIHANIVVLERAYNVLRNPRQRHSYDNQRILKSSTSGIEMPFIPNLQYQLYKASKFKSAREYYASLGFDYTADQVKNDEYNLKLYKSDFSKDYYKILGLEYGSSQVDIEEAFQQIALEFMANPDPNQLTVMEDVEEAYSILSDPEFRRRYDKYRRDKTRPGYRYPTYLFGAHHKWSKSYAYPAFLHLERNNTLPPQPSLSAHKIGKGLLPDGYLAEDKVQKSPIKSAPSKSHQSRVTIKVVFLIIAGFIGIISKMNDGSSSNLPPSYTYYTPDTSAYANYQTSQAQFIRTPNVIIATRTVWDYEPALSVCKIKNTRTVALDIWDMAETKVVDTLAPKEIVEGYINKEDDWVIIIGTSKEQTYIGKILKNSVEVDCTS